MGMRYLSVCSGIEAATVAWHPLGWQPVAFSEVDPFPSAVLAHHYPHVPNRGDMTKFQEWPDDAIDLLVGGTPCQDYSIAGRRIGMAGDRGQLTLTYVEIAAHYRPRWLVWENVPGVLSSNDGRDFARFLGDLTGTVISVPKGGWRNSGIVPGIADAYGIAYCVRDAQYVRTFGLPFAVPQRRRRVFVVGYLGDWRRAAAVLFDRESLSGHPPPRREAGQGAAPTLAARTRGGGGLGTDFDCDGGLIASNSGDVGYCLTASAQQSLDAETETLLAVASSLRAEGFDASEDGTGRQTLIPIAFDCKGTEVQHSTGYAPTLRAMGHANTHQNAGGQLAVAIQERAVSENPEAGPQGAGFNAEGAAYTLEARNKVQAVAFAENSRAEIRLCGGDGAVMSQLTTGGGKPGQDQPTIALPWAVRRLTPRECEALQGFPPNYTDVPYRRRNWTPDGPRYKALGNSMAVNCMSWIGERIALVEGLA